MEGIPISETNLLFIICMHADIEKGDEQVKVDAMRIGQYKDGEFPTDSRELAKRLFYTVYMGTENR
jgi:NAD+ synthase (glutamine-hydrolysing)